MFSEEDPSLDAAPSSAAPTDGSPKAADLVITVENPVRIGDGLMDSHAVYTVHVKTSRSQFASVDFTSQRRYSDFDWLHETLTYENPRQIIPPMPPKHILSERSKFDPVFLESRRAGLQRFLGRIAHHPILSLSKSFTVFCEAKSHELQTYKKSLERGFFSKVSDGITNVASKISVKDEEFTKVKVSVDEFEDSLKKLTVLSQKTLAAQQGAQKELVDFGVSFTAMVEIETGLVPALRKMATAKEFEARLIGEYSLSYEDRFIQVISEYSLWAQGIRYVLQHRDNSQFRATVTQQHFRTKERELEAAQTADPKSGFSFFSKDPAAAKQEKIAKLQLQVSEAMKEADKYDTELEGYNKDVRADMLRFEEQKATDVKQMIVDLADANIAYLQQLRAHYAGLIRDLEEMPISA